MREQLALALTDSDNALTEILARQAAYRSGAGTDFAGVGAWVVSQVAALGLDTAGVTLSDASGLSRENRVRASLLSDVLVLGYDGNHPVLRRALDGLPDRWPDRHPGRPVHRARTTTRPAGPAPRPAP